MYKKLIKIIVILGCFTLSLKGQDNDCYCELRNKEIFIGIENYIQLIDGKYQSVTIENVTATFEEYDTKLKQNIDLIKVDNNYKIKITKIGKVTLHIKAKNCEATRTLNVVPITATPRIGGYTSNENKKIKWAELLASAGIIASVDCCGFDAKCLVKGYEVFIIQSDSKVLKSINVGGRFTKETQEIIRKSKAKDIILFRNIKYNCPGSDAAQRMPDMTLEIE